MPPRMGTNRIRQPITGGGPIHYRIVRSLVSRPDIARVASIMQEKISPPVPRCEPGKRNFYVRDLTTLVRSGISRIRN